jgi:Tol biopolymer transport system component
VRDRTLMAQPFDARQGKPTGDSVPVAEQINYSPTQIQGQFSASQNGLLVYASGAAGENDQLAWFDRSGNPLGKTGPPGNLSRPAISPDGNTVAVDRFDPQTLLSDLWLYDLRRGTGTRFTFNSRANGYPVWSPDGSHIAFSSGLGGGANIYQKSISGMATDEALDKTERNKLALDWSQDGRYLIEAVLNPNAKWDVWVLPIFGDRKPFPYLQTGFTQRYARLSPDGRWLAYRSDETTRGEIYVQTFPHPAGKWQISTNGGTCPVWSRDGRELFYIGADQKLMVVEVMGGNRFEAGMPKPLFETHLGTRSRDIWFDVSKDGRFLMPTPVENAAPAPMTVVVNWTAGLKK